MSISITIDLSDSDLEHFKAAQKAAEQAAAGKSSNDVVAAAVKLLSEAKTNQLPDFVRERLLGLDSLIAMLRDPGFALPDADRQRVVSALLYFVDPKDIIPDNVPVLGYLDDAIMIELCLRELHNELEAYEDFCDFRAREAKLRGVDPATLGREDFLESRREELIERMHQRRERDFGTGYGRSSGYARKGYTRSWRPGIFGVS